MIPVPVVERWKGGRVKRVCLAIPLLVTLLINIGVLPAVFPSHAFNIEERYEVSEFVHHQLQEAGFETNVMCTRTTLSIDLVSMSGNKDQNYVVWLLANLTGIGHMLKGTHEVEDDFRLKFNLGAKGYLISTVGKLDGFARKLKERKVTPEDLMEAFEFRRISEGNEEIPNLEEQ